MSIRLIWYKPPFNLQCCLLFTKILNHLVFISGETIPINAFFQQVQGDQVIIVFSFKNYLPLRPGTEAFDDAVQSFPLPKLDVRFVIVRLI